MITKKLRSTTHVCSALMLSIGLSGCFNMSKDNSSNAPANSSASLLNANYVGTAGMKNADQLFKSLAVVTGMGNSVASAGTSSHTTINYLAGQMGYNGTTAIGTQYTTIKPFLSANGQYTTVNPAMLLSYTGLVGQVCSVWAANEANGTTNILAGTGISFSGTAPAPVTVTGTLTGGSNIVTGLSSVANLAVGDPVSGTGIPSDTTIVSINGNSMVLSYANTSVAHPAIVTETITIAKQNATIITAMAKRFWNRAPTGAEIAILNDAMTNAVTTVPDTGTQGVQDVLTVTCTIMLVSPAFLAA